MCYILVGIAIKMLGKSRLAIEPFVVVALAGLEAAYL